MQVMIFPYMEFMLVLKTVHGWPFDMPWSSVPVLCHLDGSLREEKLGQVIGSHIDHTSFVTYCCLSAVYSSEANPIALAVKLYMRCLWVYFFRG
jgi:hypothetical protein